MHECTHRKGRDNRLRKRGEGRGSGLKYIVSGGGALSDK